MAIIFFKVHNPHHTSTSPESNYWGIDASVTYGDSDTFKFLAKYCRYCRHRVASTWQWRWQKGVMLIGNDISLSRLPPHSRWLVRLLHDAFDGYQKKPLNCSKADRLNTRT